MKIKLKNGSLPYRFLIWFGMLCLKIWYKTLRIQRQDPRGITTGSEIGNYAVAMWHNRILGMLPVFNKKFRENTISISSRSGDGQIMCDCLVHFGMKAIRGSSNKNGKDKGGAVALIACIHALKEGHNICFTVDGPRGPLYEAKPGIIKASQKAGVKILPISVNMNSYWQLKSWDRLQIPKPFSKIQIIIEEPITIEKNWDDVKLEEELEKLNKTLMKITIDKK